MTNQEEVSCKSNVEGSFKFKINNRNIVKWDFSSTSDVMTDVDVLAGSYSSIDINGQTNGSTTVTVTFTPRDTTKYNSASRTINVNVSGLSSGTGQYKCTINRTNITVCSYTRYANSDAIITLLKNSNSDKGYGCISKTKTWCGAAASSCYDLYYCEKK